MKNIIIHKREIVGVCVSVIERVRRKRVAWLYYRGEWDYWGILGELFAFTCLRNWRIKRSRDREGILIESYYITI